MDSCIRICFLFCHLHEALFFSVKNPSTSKRKVYLSLADKLDILNMHDDGVSFVEIGRLKNMSESTVRLMYKRKDKIRAQAACGTPTNSTAIFTSRSRMLEETEKQLSLWILDLDQRGSRVLKSQIKNHARSLFLQIQESLEDKTEKEAKEIFKASNGWFERFKKRNEIERIISTDGTKISYVSVSESGIN